MSNPFKIQLPANELGKDYVIGDLHGCYNELQKLLNFVGFNREKDRLFSVGDLIHRGHQSNECLGLLKERRYSGEQWFYSTVGNHDVYGDQIMFQKWGVNCEPYENELKSLPVIYQVEHPVFGYFWVTHGELNSQILFGEKINQFQLEKRSIVADVELYQNINNNQFYQLTDQDKMNAKIVEENLSQEIKKVLLDDNWLPSAELQSDSIWGRGLFTYFFHFYKDKIVHGDFSFLNHYKNRTNDLKIFCGHNLVPFPMTIGNQIYLDTGACFGYDENAEKILKGFSLWGSQFFGLTMVDIDMGTAYMCISSIKSLPIPNQKSPQLKRGDIVQMQEPLYKNIFNY